MTQQRKNKQALSQVCTKITTQPQHNRASSQQMLVDTQKPDKLGVSKAEAPSQLSRDAL